MRFTTPPDFVQNCIVGGEGHMLLYKPDRWRHLIDKMSIKKSNLLKTNEFTMHWTLLDKLAK